MKMERRNFLNNEIRMYKDEDSDKEYIEGHAAVFGVESRDLGGFVEIIEQGAFDDVMEDDVRALFNHDFNFVLARTKSKTLKIKQTKKGLKYRFEVPNTTFGKDLQELVRRGDIDESSFGFTIKDKGDEWSRDSEGKVIRTIKRGGIGALFDISPVTIAAYPSTDVATRSYTDFLNAEKESQQEKRKENIDYYKNRLTIKQRESQL